MENKAGPNRNVCVVYNVYSYLSAFAHAAPRALFAARNENK